MKNFYLYLEPKAGEPYRFVTGTKRRWLFRRKTAYSYLPTFVRVNDYRDLMELQLRASKENDCAVHVVDADRMTEQHGDNLYWAVVEPLSPVMYYTGKWFRNDGRHRTVDGRKPVRVAEVTADVRDAQLFVRRPYAEDEQRTYNRMGFSATVQEVYVNTRNEFCEPCVVILCINEKTGDVRYLKSYKHDDSRLRYADSPDDAMVIYPERMEELYDYLSSRHKGLSFTMVVKPDANITACELRKHEAELVQRIGVDFYIGN
jgi:hypothetical protein